MAGFEFTNFTIDRAIAHIIKVKERDQLTLPQIYNDLLEIDTSAKTLIQVRVSDALGKRSHGVEMDISRNEADDPAQLCGKIIVDPDEQFIPRSQDLARGLQKAQTSPGWPGGVLIVIYGTVGTNAKKCVVIIKAETDKGFNAVDVNGRIKFELVKQMLLSATQRLYKIGMLVEDAQLQLGADGLYDKAHFRCFLFDHMLTGTETGRPTAYFYDAFLGMSIRDSDRKKTKIFYEATKEFINASRLFTDEEKAAHREALRATLNDNEPHINANDFAERHFPVNVVDDYLSHLADKNFPSNSVMKDREYIKSQLRKPRTTTMTSGVKILVPAGEAPSELVQKVATENGYTDFRIKGLVRDQN